MLELRPACENCNRALPPDSADAMICTFEYTFCRTCGENVLGNVCPNCGDGFCPRPVRPKTNLFFARLILITTVGAVLLMAGNAAPAKDRHMVLEGLNGDVIEHIVHTAKLILENPSLWSQEAPADTYGFGKTYLDRAKPYVNECQKSAETSIVPWFVRNTRDGCHLVHPDTPVYYKYCESKGPVPWNQQQMIVGGLLRLTQCHPS
jgi:hypothetical protein